MTKKKEPKEPKEQEQLDLIDVRPENAKQILLAARSYKNAQKKRLDALGREVQEKQKVLDFVKKAKLKPLEDGTIRFKLDGVTISVKPRDELLTVKCDDDGD